MSMEKAEKAKNKAAAKRQEEELTNRILAVFCAGLLTLLGVMSIYRLLLTPGLVSAVLGASFAAGLVFAAFGAAALVFSYMKRRKDSSDFWVGRLAIIGVICFIYAGVLLFIHYRSFSAFRVLYVALPVMAFLYLIYNIYQKDFFWQCVVAGCSGGVLYAFSRWLHHRPWHPIVHITYIAALTLLAAAVFALFALRKRKGVLFGIRVFQTGANYRLMFITFALMIAVIAAVLFIGSGAAFWAMVGVFAYLFVLAVYYTIRLM